MRKYWAIFKVNWQNSVEYRGEFLAHLVRGIITLVVMVFIFRAIFKQTDNFAGYTFPSIFTYLVMVRILHFATRGNTARLIADEIKEGRLSIYLLKPVGYLKYWFSSFFADRLFELGVRFSLIFIFLFLFPAYFKLPSVEKVFLFVLFLIISLVFNFLFNVFLALFAFWVTDIRLFSSVAGLAMGFFAGELIPLDMLPITFKGIGLFLPFQYTLFFPIKLWQGSLTVNQIIGGVFASFLWIGAILLFLNYFWRKGLRQYEAIGQ